MNAGDLIKAIESSGSLDRPVVFEFEGAESSDFTVSALRANEVRIVLSLTAELKGEAIISKLEAVRDSIESADHELSSARNALRAIEKEFKPK